MKRESVIEFKLTTNYSNPAKSEVIEQSSDDVLSEYVKIISAYPQLTFDEEKQLATQIERGDIEAKQSLIKSNLKLVITIAKKVIHTSNLPFVDLIQEGNLGLLIAAEKYNYRLGYRFSTYAAWWVKQAMFKAISEQSHCMKIPVYVQETLAKFSKIKSRMEQDLNDKVTVQDVAQKMNISNDKIESFLLAFPKTISIENGIEKNDGKDINVSDILPDDDTSIFEKMEYKSLQNDINNVIKTLKDREQEVVKMRYGLNNSEKYTLEEIGNIYGVTKECIRQTEIRALKKLKISGACLLNDYLN